MRRALPFALSLPLVFAAPPADASHYISTKVWAGGSAETGAYGAACLAQTTQPAVSLVVTCSIGDLSRTVKGAGRYLVSAVAGVPATRPVEACVRVTATMIVPSEMGPVLTSDTESTCTPLITG